MSILERSALPPPPAAETPRSDRLRVITGGGVGNMEARLGTSGFDVVAVAETEDALIDAVSAAEPDAIIVEADLCASLEHIRDLAPDALLIVVGDHTPAGALGRIERGVSGTVMAGILHALVAEGVGAAVGWGLVPAFGQRGGLQVPQRINGFLLSAKADLLRDYVANALRDHAELVTAASTVAVTVSASVLLTMSPARTRERPQEHPARVVVPAATAQRTLQSPVVAVFPTTRSLTRDPSLDQGVPGTQRGQNRTESWDRARHVLGIAGVLGQGEIAGIYGQGDVAGAHGQGDIAGAHGQGNGGEKGKDDDQDDNESEDGHGQGNDGEKDKDSDQDDNESEDGHGQGNGGEKGKDDDQDDNESEDGHGQGNDGEKDKDGDDQADQDDHEIDVTEQSGGGGEATEATRSSS
jgi:hypothetical protein